MKAIRHEVVGDKACHQPIQAPWHRISKRVDDTEDLLNARQENLLVEELETPVMTMRPGAEAEQEALHQSDRFVFSICTPERPKIKLVLQPQHTDVRRVEAERFWYRHRLLWIDPAAFPSSCVRVGPTLFDG